MRPPFSSGEPDPIPASRNKPASKGSAPVVLGELIADVLPDRPAVPASDGEQKPAPRKPVARKAPAKAAKKAASKTDGSDKAAPATKDAESTSAASPRPPRELGPVEAATLAELEEAQVSRSALAASCLAMARNVDEADTAAGAASAARELRMTLPLALTTRKPLSPPASEEGQGETTVVPPNRLTALRSKAERRGTTKAQRRAR